jgi:hypothetical protein
MPKQIDVPGMGIVEFPDDMTDDQIVSAIQANSSQGNSQQTKTQQFLAGLTDENSPVSFILGAGDSAANQMRNVANLAPWTNLPEITPKSKGTAYDLGGFAGEMAGFMGGGIGLNAARKAAEAAPLIGKGAEWLGKSGLLPSMARLGSGGAVYGGVMNPDDRMLGAALGGTVGAASPAIAKGVSKLMPSNWSSLLPDQLKRNLSTAKGTETNLGAVIGSPQLKNQYENILSNVPFSGANAQMMRTSQEIEKRSNDILSKYLGNTSPLEVEDKLAASLMNAFKEQTASKNALYKTAQDMAPKAGFSLKTNKLGDKISEHKDALSAMSLDAPTKDLLQKAMSPIRSLTGAPSTSQVGLKEANLLASKLNHAAKNYGASTVPQDRFNADVLGSLGSALKSDIKQSVKDTGNKEFVNQFAKAEKNYKDNFSGFLDKDIYKFLNGDKKAEDILSTFIKTGKNTDKGDQLSKLMSKLDPEAQNLAKYSYLSRAMKGSEDKREVGAGALKSLWKDTNLGQKQKRALMPNKVERQQMDKLAELIELNPKAIHLMENPPTGHRWLSAIPSGIGAGIGAIAAHRGEKYNSGEGALAGALLGAGTLGGSRAAAKLLSSESLRNALVARMIKPKVASTGINTLAGSGLAQSLANAMQNQ